MLHPITLKVGSKWSGLKAEILLGVIVAYSVYTMHGYAFTLTEGTGGKHMNGSKHYDGQAVDIRTRHLPAGMKSIIAQDLRECLGKDYDVVEHETHIHLEFDPK